MGGRLGAAAVGRGELHDVADVVLLVGVAHLAQQLARDPLHHVGVAVAEGLSGRNLENVRNVGLDCLAILDCDLADQPLAPDAVALEGPQMSRDEFKHLVAQAHQVLAEDPRVKAMFQDVNTFLGNDPGPERQSGR